ncbi:hypothetical protein EMCRGX_G000649 [Ephydatia muelleri]
MSPLPGDKKEKGEELLDQNFDVRSKPLNSDLLGAHDKLMLKRTLTLTFGFFGLLRYLHLYKLLPTCGCCHGNHWVLPQLSVLMYDCLKCGFVLGPFFQRHDQEVKHGTCPECQSNEPSRST